MATDENQRKYLQNLVAGKTSTGGVANAGQQSWAKQQLAKMPQDTYANAVNNVKDGVTSAPSAPAVVTPMSRTNQTLADIRNKTDQGFQFKAPDSFTYNQDNDPAYQAALASARQNITQQQADTNAYLRAGGQGKSSYSESVANQIGTKEMARISTDVLPQLISQAYQRYADNANRDLAVQQANYGAQQDQISNLARLYGLQNQQDFQNPMAEAQLTGQYMPTEARALIDQLIDLKRAWPTLQGDAQRAATAQGVDLRARIASYGVNPDLFAANVSANDSVANVGRAGVLTNEARDRELRRETDQRNYDRGVLESDRNFEFTKGQTEWENNFRQVQTEWENNFKQGQFDWQKAQQTWENAFQEKNFQQQMKEAAASRGLQWANLNQRQKEFVADQAFKEKQFAFEQEKFTASKSGGNKSDTYDFKTDPMFRDEIAWINSNPGRAENEIRSNAQDIIAQYGYNGYQELLKTAGGAAPKDNDPLGFLKK